MSRAGASSTSTADMVGDEPFGQGETRAADAVATLAAAAIRHATLAVASPPSPLSPPPPLQPLSPPPPSPTALTSTRTRRHPPRLSLLATTIAVVTLAPPPPPLPSRRRPRRPPSPPRFRSQPTSSPRPSPPPSAPQPPRDHHLMHACAAHVYFRRGMMRPGGRHLAGSAQLGESYLRARACRDSLCVSVCISARHCQRPACSE